ncbi:hypothetical protein BDN70DRAFT_870310 [Pholiota conissans]|uniref:Uncharacterized protein n=1 Tax=Pholiota conissans TaxID=109636 RepID=A0A9P5ZFM3_9AGAR|nr:hypothetical protein BDN70DRAFT_870310 [Pholiota conissans]
MHAKALSSPPSSFRNSALQTSSSSGAEPSSSGSNSTSKRQSMSGASSSSAGPRPLHLALGSVVSPSTALSSPSTSSLGGQVPDEANDFQVLTSKRDSIQSASSSRGPLSPTVASLRKDTASRKRSSIAYIPSTPNSPSYLQTNRYNDLDSFSAAPSPLSSSHARTTFPADGKGSGLVRTSSLGRKEPKTPRSASYNDRSSTGSMLANSDLNIANAMAHLKERPPLTLNEKHADLLHFIAQKESKCLELRSQLAVHEAELLQLKRKWEKIVNRGFEKALSPNTASTSLHSSTSSAAPSYPAESTSPNNSAGYFPALNSANTNAPATVVLEGIKESMQGMSRLIVAGLGSIAHVNPAPETIPAHSAGVNPNAPLPLRLGSAQRRANDSGHGQTESQSSSSTTMSATSNTTSSSFLSASTASSATSAGSSSSMTDNTMKKSGTSEAETESEFGEFTDGQTRQRSATLTEHLIVEDTGATPMMSPNPRFQRRKLVVDDASLSSLANSNISGTAGGSLLLSGSQHATDSSSKDDFDWDEGWDEPSTEAQFSELFLESNITTTTKKAASSNSAVSTAYTPTATMDSRQSRAHESDGTKSPLSPTQAHMSSWVGSVGKKWGEIKGSSAFSKNQKRASVLLSDIQQTFVSSLMSPLPPSSDSSKSAYPTPTTPSSYTALSSNASHLRTPTTPLPKTLESPNNTSNTLPQRRSLIDDSDDESFGESADDTIKTNMPPQMPLAARMMSSSVMVPDAAPPPAVKAKRSADKNLKTSVVNTKVDDDDEWNW